MATDAHHAPRARTAIPPIQSLSGLEFIWLEITQHCNLMCRHCYTNSSPARPHSDIDWRALIDQAHALGCRQIQFIGGEPLSHPRLSEYVRRAAALGYEFIEVYTNLSLLTDDVCDAFGDCGVHVATSFYSAREGVHDRLTGVAGSFDSTLRAMKKILKRRLPMRVGVVAVNADDKDLDDTSEFLRGMGIARDDIRVDHVRPVGRGTKMTPFESVRKTLCGACWRGKLTVSYDGNCYPCVFSRHLSVGNVKTESLAEIVISHKLQHFRQSMFDDIATTAQCSPDCDPSGPCDPNCTPGGKCDPPCNPDGCRPVGGACVPDNGCAPSRPCNPRVCMPNPGF
jgi:MoaA/NifB/PqqE/SkfB family radical SAM enzyme